ncbi:MAG: hypothetical protein GY830_02300 [Bacteroidetes bacterium]|nr:hypothetical protein [Bacteroidota bacterium]
MFNKTFKELRDFSSNDEYLIYLIKYNVLKILDTQKLIVPEILKVDGFIHGDI